MRILVADDDIGTAMLLRKLLTRLGHKPTACYSGSEAWELVQQQPFELLLADVELSGLDGAALCQRVRSRKTGNYLWVILSTVRNENADEKVDGLEAGADDFLLKPIDPRELKARVDVAERLLRTQRDLCARTGELDDARLDLEEQNSQLAKTMVYLGAANQRFSELFHGLPTPCFTFDNHGRIHEWNQACERLYGVSAARVFSKPVWEAFGAPENSAHVEQMVGQVLRGERIQDADCAIRSSDGRTVNVLCSSFPLFGADGEVVGAISATVDITERKQLETKVAAQLREANELNVKLAQQREELARKNMLLAEQATTDSLTGLRNHRYFIDALAKTFAHARRHKQDLSIILLDVDRFKEYNDSFGHPAGDEVLRILASLLSTVARCEDDVARCGGEEFVLILPGTNAAGARSAAERLRANVERLDWPLRQLTASVGIASLGPETMNAEQLVSEADRALYQSKAAGRNCVSHWHDVAERKARAA